MELSRVRGKHRGRSPRLGKECAMAGSLQPRPLARLFVSGGQRYAPGARNRSQINVAGAGSSRLARIQRCLRIRTIYQAVFQSFCSGVSATVRGRCQPAARFFFDP